MIALTDHTVKPALVIAHPGHELRLATWVARSRPLLFVVAKGSRSGRSESRLAASRATATELGAICAEPFGAAFDTELYDAILGGDIDLFARLTDALSAAFVARGVDQVVTDGWQNYNPVHDLTHLVARVAAAEAGLRGGRPVACLDYPVVLGELAQAACGQEWARIALSEAQVEAKLAMAARHPDIAEDVEALIAAAGRPALRLETLHVPPPLGQLLPTPIAPPWYERHGRARVAAGVYGHALTWAHMAPIVSALAERLTAAEAELVG
jgi:hypothetical protein